MTKLFETTTIRNLELKNRFVRSATWLGMADKQGKATPRLINTMTDLAKGNVGLIITGHVHVQLQGQASVLQLGIFSDDLVPSLEKMTRAVHDSGGKIAAQLAHAGIFALEKTTGMIPLAVSDAEGIKKTPVREMDGEDIKTLVTDFGKAAKRAKDAGFDAVQIHSAHGYLLSQFLSPLFNRRTDAYGGPIENRVRIHLDIIEEIRKEVGPHLPIMIKINCQDFSEHGLDTENAAAACKILENAGLDAVEHSGGLLTSKKLSPSRMGINSEEKEAYFKAEALKFKEKIDIPLILVGGIRSLKTAETIINEGTADYIAMSRPFIREPDLIKRWESGDTRKAQCKSDNLCFAPGIKGQGVYCVTLEKEGELKKS
ncbi:MAG: NADH:flavin oxidoreductase [Thermodesulfobacteriota bacterium]|nr:NADH:flavin oxidoreductase [Thermodesulfobacteriota bacterium]